MTIGLRERKRTETSAAIEAAALELFRTKGYGDTTVDDIAVAADVSRATVFRHFPLKEDILFAGDAADGAVLVAAASKFAADGELTFDRAVRASILAFADHLVSVCDRVWVRWDIVVGEPRLLGRAYAAYARWADQLVEALVVPVDEGEVSLGAHAVATSSIAALYEAIRYWHRSRGDLRSLVAEALDAVRIGLD